MKKWQTRSFVCTLVILFVGMNLSGLLIGSTTNSAIVAPESNDLQIKSDYYVILDSDLAQLNDSLTSSDNVYIDPGEIISGTVYNTTEIINCADFYVIDTDFAVTLTLKEVNITRDFVIAGSPTVTMVNVNVSRNMTSNGFGATSIGSPVLDFTDVITPLLRMDTTAGTMALASSTITDLYILGEIIVTISADSSVTNIHETVVPTVTATQINIPVPYTFLFQPTAQVTLSWTGDDNILGPNYGLNYTLKIYKSGIYDQTITNLATTTHVLTLDTAASSYTIQLTATDKQGNVSLVETIVIDPIADLLWFILMIVIIAGAAVGIVLLMYMRKQRQWQKTSLMEIPT